MGALLLIGLISGRLFWTQLEPLVDSLFRALALAPNAYPDAQAFLMHRHFLAIRLPMYSYWH